tara:strand:- start:660 stop:1412 length:753 start_codon:yes stop_codon:yes gene_type:complete
MLPSSFTINNMIKTNGIIINHYKYSDTSVIIKIFSEEEGLISSIIKGAKSQKKKYNSSLIQRLSIVELIYKKNHKSDLVQIIDIKSKDYINNIYFNSNKRIIALFMSEFLSKIIKESGPNKSLYIFIENSIKLINITEKKIISFHLMFMIKITKYLGFYPTIIAPNKSKYFDILNGIFTNIKPNHNYLLSGHQMKCWILLLKTEFTKFDELNFSQSESKATLKNLNLFYKLHVDNYRKLKSDYILDLLEY